MAWLIFLGFACLTLSVALLYFRVTPSGLYKILVFLWNNYNHLYIENYIKLYDYDKRNKH